MTEGVITENRTVATTIAWQIVICAHIDPCCYFKRVLMWWIESNSRSSSAGIFCTWWSINWNWSFKVVWYGRGGLDRQIFFCIDKSIRVNCSHFIRIVMLELQIKWFRSGSHVAASGNVWGTFAIENCFGILPDQART